MVVRASSIDLNSSAFNIYFDSLKFQDKQLSVKIGENQFSEKGININIYTKDIIIQGNLNFSHLSPIKYDIMGPFQFIPFMQCRHSVYSMRHRIDGQINVNGQPVSYTHLTLPTTSRV